MGYVGVAPGTTTFTIPANTKSGYETISLADWVDDKFYGTVQLTNGQTNPLEIFSNGRAQPIPGGTRIQTRVDTNILRAGTSGLQRAHSMLVFGLGLEVVRAMRANNAGNVVLGDGAGALSDPATQRTIFELRTVFFEYEYNNKSYSQGVLLDYPQGVGISLHTTNPAREQANNGLGSPRDRATLVLPIYERGELGYNWTVQPEAALIIAQPASDGGNNLDNADLKGRKWGLIKRSVV